MSSEPHCPYCNSADTISIEYGFPSPRMQAQMEDKTISWGGCIVGEEGGDPDRSCTVCHAVFFWPPKVEEGR